MKEKKSKRLRSRVVTSFLLLTIIPVILTAAAVIVTMRIQTNHLRDLYGLEDASYENLYDNSLMISAMVDKLYEQVSQTAQDGTSGLEDNSVLNQLNDELKKCKGFLVVRKNNEIYYNGDSVISDSTLLEELPAYGSKEESEEVTLYLQYNRHYLVRQMDFTFGDSSRGSLFLIVNMNQLSPVVKSSLVTIVCIIVLMLALTSSLVSVWIYRSIIGPVNQIRTAAREIRDGNLDFSVESSSISELDDLCSDFEAMRLRLKESAEENVQNEQDSKELISNISHDLKTPITSVKGYCEGIMDGVADTPEKMDRYIRTIYNKTIEMDRLINELTLYSKINTNKIPYTFTKIHVNDYFTDCVEELQLDLQAKNIEFSYYNYLTEDCIVIADAEQLSRVINNIISNSVKYMNKERKVINMRMRDVGDSIQIEIEDNGKGIAQKDVAKIFERFYRTDSSRNSSMGGSGIGLSIVRKIIEDHGGRVWAASKEDVGTVIYIVLRKYQEVTVNAEKSEDTDNRGRRGNSRTGEGLSGTVRVSGRNRESRRSRTSSGTKGGI